MICKHIYLLYANSICGNFFKQSSHSQTHNAILSTIFLLGPSVLSAISALENLILLSTPNIYYISQTLVHYLQPYCPESSNFNTFTDVIFTNLI